MAAKRVVVDDMIFDISYELLNPKMNKDIVFLHGWGSNKELMRNSFGSYLNEYRHIYIDLPGFGKSSNDYVINTHVFAEVIDEFLRLLNSSKDIVLGHSYGGKVALLLNPKMLILLSSSGILLKKGLRVRLKIATFKLFSKIGLKRFGSFLRADDAKGLNPNMYEIFKIVVNEDFSQHFKGFKNDCLIFWGRFDSATPLICGKMINSYIKNSYLHIFEDEHYFFLKYSKHICGIMIDKLSS